MSGIKDRLNAFGAFVWNSEEKKFLGRGGRSWAEIGVFYLIYYVCLGCFFVGMLVVFYKTLDEQRPKLTGDSSLLKANPGMGFKPMPDVEYTLIRFKKDPDTYKDHITSIKKLLQPYIDANKEGKGVDCEKVTPQAGQSCKFDLEGLMAECNEKNSFGYGAEREPCVLMRLNRIFDWMPQEYNSDNVKQSGASPELQVKMLNKSNMIWVECVGENPADRDNLGEVKYFPQQGFPHMFYPFTNQKDYMSPLVFVKFASPEKMMALMVECRALAPNIKYDRTEKEGGVHFELLVDVDD